MRVVMIGYHDEDVRSFVNVRQLADSSERLDSRH